LVCIDPEHKSESDPNNTEQPHPLTKDYVAENMLKWRLPPQFLRSKQITWLFVNFQRELAFLLLDHVASFKKRIAASDKCQYEGRRKGPTAVVARQGGSATAVVARQDEPATAEFESPTKTQTAIQALPSSVWAVLMSEEMRRSKGDKKSSNNFQSGPSD